MYNRAMARMTNAGTVLLGLAVGLGACAHEPGGWKVVSSDHFNVYTDQRAHDYEWVVERLEDVHAGLSQSFFSETATPPLEVFLFGELEFQELVSNRTAGIFFGNHGHGTLILSDAGDPAFIDHITAHEVSHGFIHATFPSVPIWYNEGFASYLESMVVEEGEHRVTFGSLNAGISVEAGIGRMVPVQQLFTARWDEFHGDWEHSHYAAGWALIHYIEHGENKQLRGRFDAFSTALAKVTSERGSGTTAWTQVYPEIPFNELDGRVRDHVNRSFDKHRDSRIAFKFVRPERAPLRIAPANMPKVDGLRAKLRRERRPDKL
jgi:hypothetical protein